MTFVVVMSHIFSHNCHNNHNQIAYSNLHNTLFVGMERILRGVMRYRHTTRLEMVKEFQRVRDNPEPKAVFFTCMDSRMIPTRFT